ncbi:MAG: elongation factor G [Clostridiaceae bacterium]|nr:elongation factor G [Clostridiaceae bacterium]
MNKFPVGKIRNVCIMGQGSSGKTSLVEAMLYNAGASERLGKVVDGTTVCDYDPEEIKRKFSINASLAPFEWKGNKINVIDTPGYLDFDGEAYGAVKACDGVVIVLSGNSGVSVGSENAWELAKSEGLPVICFVNKVDHENANFINVVNSLKEVFGNSIAPFRIPIKEDLKITGYVNLVTMKAYKVEGNKETEIEIPTDMLDQVKEMREALCEAVAETSEELMEKYFEGIEFTEEEMRNALRIGVRNGDIVPVYGGSATENIGVTFLQDAIVKYFPSPDESTRVLKDSKGEELDLKADDSGQLAAIVFKTFSDPYVGKMSLFRVYSGTIKADSSVYNPNKDATEKIGHIYILRGKKQIEVSEIGAGDIGVVTKLVATTTGDTLTQKQNPVTLAQIEFPRPNLSMAVLPKAKGDEEKISAGLTKLTEEDPTFAVYNNLETRQTIISGIGEMHLEVIVSKLQSKFATSVTLSEPKVAYRETIRKKVKAEGKHKKQTGGHGQYGHVFIEFEPGDQEDLVFEEKIFGGAVPKNYIPAVEKGLRECIQKGVLAGYPVVNLKATLVDGSYHPVDSSEMAFKVAASIAYKEGLKNASPVLLEPIGSLKVIVPESNMGDIIGDINKRRGRILGMNPIGGGKSMVEAEVPMAEMHKYATDLRSITQGRGKFTFDFVRYEEAPANIAQKVIEESKVEEE